MPTYDYVCDACGHAFEQFQSMKDDALTDCPACEASALRRLIGGGSGIIFKGSGFYETDYKRQSNQNDQQQQNQNGSTQAAQNGSQSNESSQKSDSGASNKSESAKSDSSKSDSSKKETATSTS